MSLQAEIRMALESEGKPMSAQNILFAMNVARLGIEFEDGLPKLDVIRKTMGRMSDVTATKVGKVWYHKIDNAGFKEHTIREHARAILFLSTVMFKRVEPCKKMILKLYASTAPMKWLEEIRTRIRERLGR